MVASSWAGTPATSAWVGSVSISAFIAGSRLDASKPPRPIATTIRSGSDIGHLSRVGHRLDRCDPQCGAEEDQPGDVEAAVDAERGGDEAAHAVADHEQRQCAVALVEPRSGVVEEVGGVVALQGDATDPFGAAVRALIERVNPVAGRGEAFGDVFVSAGVLAAAVEDRDQRLAVHQSVTMTARTGAGRRGR